MKELIHRALKKNTSKLNYLFDKTVLVTGAGGSIGSELSEQVAELGAKTIILLGVSEKSISEIYRRLHDIFPSVSFFEVIGNITNYNRMEEVFSKYKPDIIFHCAAHKHVDIMESNVKEAIENNIYGTKNIALLSMRFKAEKFILVSSDKAVYPVSIMGATKRVCELYINRLQQLSYKTKFITTRLGNVLGSQGSVIEIFESQIQNCKPITITDENMTRYFLTIPEAVELILHAGDLGSGGEIFVMDMGDPIKIKDLAIDLIKLHGLKPYEDVPIKYIGLRPGEKLNEQLRYEKEELEKTEHERIFKVKQPELDWFSFDRKMRLLESLKEEDHIKRVLKEIIPEYNG